MYMHTAYSQMDRLFADPAFGENNYVVKYLGDERTSPMKQQQKHCF